MGLFDKDSAAVAKRRNELNDAQKKFSNKKNEKAQKKLTKKGFDLTGLLMLDVCPDKASTSYLLVFPDRVEHRFSVVISRWSVEVIPISQISSVSTYKQGIFERLLITTANQSIDHPCISYDAHILRSKILELKNSQQTSSSELTQSDPTELLYKLANLHKSGILTDQEFAEKKAALIKRI